MKKGRKKEEVQEDQLRGFKYFAKVCKLLQRLHDHGCQRDRAGNRVLHYDQHVTLILLCLFNPVVTSLHAIAQASSLKKVQGRLGVKQTNVVSLSEANKLFDSRLLLGIIAGLRQELHPLPRDPRFRDVQGVLTLVDSTLVTALPKLVKAMWLDEEHKAVKLHTHYELLQGVPEAITVADGNSSDWKDLAARLLPDRVYVMDRGYVCSRLFQMILDIGSSFVGRLRDNSIYRTLEESPLSPEAKAAGVVADRIVRLGGEGTKERVAQPLRVIEVLTTPHPKRATEGARGGPPSSQTMLIVTDVLDLPAEVVVLIYQQRWSIEIFFRFFKQILGCRHLLSHNNNGIEIQAYCAMIVCLLLALWTGKKPTKRTYEMACYFMMGWADEEEFAAHIEKLKDLQNKPA